MTARVSRPDAILAVTGLLAALFLVDGFFNSHLHALSPAAFWLFDAAKFILFPVLALHFLYRHYAVLPRQYGVLPIAKEESWGHFIGLVLFLTLFLSAAYFATTVFTSHLAVKQSGALTPSLVPKGLLHLPVALYLAATAGITEEIFFRGLPLLYLSLRFPGGGSAGAYCFVTAILFGSAHWENGANEAIGTFVYGFFTSAFYLQVRDLTPFMVAHTLGDLWWFS